MNAKKLAPLTERTAEEDHELKSGVRTTRDLAEALGLADDADPSWSAEPPQPLLPHDPLEFHHARPGSVHPRHEDVLEAVAGESLESGLTERLF